MLALAGCAGTVAQQPNAVNAANALQTGTATGTSGSNGSATATATGSATVSAAPDRAVVTVAVEATANNASAARTQVAEGVDELRSALSEAGYNATTVAFSISPQYDYSGDSRELVGYQASHVLEFEAQPDEAGSAVDLAVDNGATAVYGVQFTLSDERREELRDEAIAAAVGDARDTASVAAQAANASIGQPVSITVGSSGFSPYDARVSAEAAGAGTSFEPGPVTVSADVTVTYELQNRTD